MYIVENSFVPNTKAYFDYKFEAVSYAVSIYRDLVRKGEIDVRVVQHEDYDNGIFYDSYPGRVFSITTREVEDE